MKGYIYEQFNEISSTNDYLKNRRIDGKNRIAVAKQQSGGRGTKGRSFISSEGGLYLSTLTFYDNFPTDKAFEIMQNVAAAVCETLKVLGVKSQIKWPNDIFAGGRKICGILIENTFSGKNITSSVVGLGLNIYNELPQELKEIATTVLEQTGKRYEVKEVEELLLSFLQKGVKDKYESYLGFIGEEVRLLSGEKEFSGIVLGVDKQGNLLARVDGKDCVFASAEVQIVKN